MDQNLSISTIVKQFDIKEILELPELRDLIDQEYNKIIDAVSCSPKKVGQNIVRCEVTSLFCPFDDKLKAIERSDMQVIVYSEILNKIKLDKGLQMDVKILFDDSDKVIFELKFNCVLDGTEMKKRRDLLIQHKI